MAGLLSVLLLALGVGAWHLATLPKGGAAVADTEYAKLVGAQAATGAKSAFPTPADLGRKLAEHIRDPFYDHGPNDKGIGVQLAYSIGRVLLGFVLAALVAVPAGFLIGMSPLVYRALDPFIQVLKPISPLAWMPLALFTLKDSNVSAVFVIFVCSIWPMLINTAFGVASVRRDWLNVAKTLEVPALRKAFAVILPAAAPTILTGMRISDRHRLAGDRRRRDAGRRHRHRLLRVERVEQPFDRQHPVGDPGDRRGRHGARLPGRPPAARG